MAGKQQWVPRLLSDKKLTGEELQAHVKQALQQDIDAVRQHGKLKKNKDQQKPCTQTQDTTDEIAQTSSHGQTSLADTYEGRAHRKSLHDSDVLRKPVKLEKEKRRPSHTNLSKEQATRKFQHNLDTFRKHVKLEDERHRQTPLALSKEERAHRQFQCDLDLLRKHIKLEKEEQKRYTLPHDAANRTTQASLYDQAYAAALSKQPAYCEWRPKRRVKPGPYRGSAKGRPCTCASPHKKMSPRHWLRTPAEADWDYSLPNGGHPVRESKVKFADEVVTDVRYFDRWYKDEYEYSDRYWAKGPVRMSDDKSTETDDNLGITWQGAMEAIAQLKL